MNTLKKLSDYPSISTIQQTDVLPILQQSSSVYSNKTITIQTFKSTFVPLTSSHALVAESIVGGGIIDYGTVITASNALTRETSSFSIFSATSSYSLTASFALNNINSSGFVVTASIANDNTTASFSLTSSNSITASLSLNSITSSFSLTTPFAISSSNSLTSSFSFLSLPTSEAWSTVWDTSKAKDLGDYYINNELALTSTDIGSIVGGYTQATLISDGTHAPTFDGEAIPAWNNVAGARNLVVLTRVGSSIHWAVGDTLSRAAQTVAPYFPVSPTISDPLEGGTVTISGTAAGSTPITYTYQWTIDGVNVQSATSSTYTPINSEVGKQLAVDVTATNLVGSVTETTSGKEIAPVSDVLSFGSLNEMIESRSGIYYLYKPTANNNLHNANSPTKKLVASPVQDQHFSIIMDSIAGGERGIGLHTDASTEAGYFTNIWALFGCYPSADNLGGNYWAHGNAGSMTVDSTTEACQIGDIARFTRTPSNVVKFEVSHDSGSNWVQVAHKNGVTGDLFPRVSYYVQSSIPTLVKCDGTPI